MKQHARRVLNLVQYLILASVVLVEINPLNHHLTVVMRGGLTLVVGTGAGSILILNWRNQRVVSRSDQLAITYTKPSVSIAGTQKSKQRKESIMADRTLHVDHSVVEVELHDGTKAWVQSYRDDEYNDRCGPPESRGDGPHASISMCLTDAHRFRGEDADAAHRCAKYVHGKLINRMWEVSEA